MQYQHLLSNTSQGHFFQEFQSQVKDLDPKSISI